VAWENRAASELSAGDARWVMAIRVGQAIEGGRSAMLRPDRCRRLLLEGQSLGLRDFDTNLIIAIVQDGARTGEGMGANVADRVALVRSAGGHRLSGRCLLGVVAISLTLSGLWLMLLIRLFTHG